MDVLGWIVAVVVGIVAWVAGSRRVDRFRRSLEALARDLREGRTAPSGAVAAEEPTEVRELRHAVAERWTAPDSGPAPGDVALTRFASFLRRSVADPLLEGIESGGDDLRREAERVLDAVEDTEFFLEEPEAEFQPGNVTTALQEVTRELTREMNTTVKLAAPDRPIRARLAPEAFKDAIYLLLANAAHFSGGKAVELSLEEEGGRCRIEIRDKGPGFSAEALERATEPFFTTEEGALGLGLGRAARIVEMHAGELELRNRQDEGAEVVVLLPTRS